MRGEAAKPAAVASGTGMGLLTMFANCTSDEEAGCRLLCCFCSSSWLLKKPHCCRPVKARKFRQILLQYFLSFHLFAHCMCINNVPFGTAVQDCEKRPGVPGTPGSRRLSSCVRDILVTLLQARPKMRMCPFGYDTIMRAMRSLPMRHTLMHTRGGAEGEGYTWMHACSGSRRRYLEGSARDARITIMCVAVLT